MMDEMKDRILPQPSKYRDGSEQNAIELEIYQLPALGVARITAIGSENLYIEKEGLHYFCKVMNTEQYHGQHWDFVRNRTAPQTVIKASHESLEPIKTEMTEEHFLAMKAYADEHGRNWKDRLTQAWLSDWREQWGVLRTIRNHPDYHAGKGMVGIFEAYERHRKSRAQLLAGASIQPSPSL